MYFCSLIIAIFQPYIYILIPLHPFNSVAFYSYVNVSSVCLIDHHTLFSSDLYSKDDLLPVLICYSISCSTLVAIITVSFRQRILLITWPLITIPLHLSSMVSMKDPLGLYVEHQRLQDTLLSKVSWNLYFFIEIPK